MNAQNTSTNTNTNAWTCHEGRVYETVIRPADDNSKIRLYEAVKDLGLGNIVSESRRRDGTVMALIYTTRTDSSFRRSIRSVIPEMGQTEPMAQ